MTAGIPTVSRSSRRRKSGRGDDRGVKGEE